MRPEVESPQRRRRRTPGEAQREIIEAAESLLRERPFRELTVDEVMRRTELSRPSFYVYFRDRHELVLRVVQHLFSEMYVETEDWLGGSGPDGLGQALLGVTQVYRGHAHVLRALADAAADDPQVHDAYNQLNNGFVELVRKKIEEETAGGRSHGLDPQQAATAIIWMCERYFYLSFGADPVPDDEVIAGTLSTVISRSIYATVPA